MTRPLLTVAFLLLAPCLASAAPSSGELLALRARAILKKHCAECHDKSTARPPLPLLDHAKLIENREKQLPYYIKPKSADSSLILQLLEDGSMPPANKERVSLEELRDLKAWINFGDTGAPHYPGKFGDETILEALAEDAKTLPDAAVKYTRYLTLHHLIETGPLPDLTASRKAIEQALARLSTGPGAKLTPVPNTFDMLLRWDLKSCGWEANKFHKVTLTTDHSEKNPTPFNLFDLVLLEYPFGVPPGTDVTGAMVSNTFMSKVEQIRPIPFVRADWFVNAIGDTRLASDLRAILDIRGNPTPPVPFPGPKPSTNFLSLRADDVPANAIPAINGYYAADPLPRPKAPIVKLEVVDKDLMPTTRLSPKARFAPAIASNTEVFFEMIYVEAEQTIFVFHALESVKEKWQVSDKPLPLYLNEKEKKLWGISENTETGTEERFVLYFSENRMPPGMKLRFGDDAKTPRIERFYHPVPPAGLAALTGISRTSTGWKIVR